ncbi:MAG: hypothetical protein RIC15_07650 [Vicingaceae bacterium]
MKERPLRPGLDTKMTFNLKSPFIAGAVILVLFLFFRLFVGGWDFSYFVVAGDDFVDSGVNEIKTQQGPGYDGQFFYHFALDPTGNSNTGITVDHPAYRHQRILYPVLAWLFAFGSWKFIPFTLVLVNVLSLLFSIALLEKMFEKFELDQRWSYLPFLLSGLWMALGRDLAEVLELFLLISFLFALSEKKRWLTVTLATAILFTRESSVLLIGPILLYLAARSMNKFKELIMLSFPLITLAIWKACLYFLYASPQVVEGSNNLTWPVLGIYQGFMQNYQAAFDLTGIAEFMIWIMHFTWNAWLVALCATLIIKRVQGIPTYLIWAWISGLFFALCFSASIYNDDWSFARVLTGFNLLSFLILAYGKRMPSKYFVLYTFALTATTVLRLWLRP